MPEGRICLVGVGGSINGLRWQSTPVLRIGREPSVDVVVSDPSVAPIHAEIRVTPRGWTVRNAGKSATTLVNGIPVNGPGRVLAKCDVLQCGKLAFEVDELELERPQAPPPAQAPRDIKASGAMLRIEALSHRSWEQGLREAPGGGAADPGKQLLSLLRAGYHFSRIDCVAELLQSLLDDTVAALDAQHGALLIADAGGVLRLQCVCGLSGRGPTRHFSGTLAQRCYGKGESMLCSDAALPETASVLHGAMSSIICGVLRTARHRLGVLHLSRGPRQAPFTQSDLDLVDAIAATVSVGIESALAVDRDKSRVLDESVAMLAYALALRHPEAAAHAQRTAELAARLAEPLGLSADDQSWLRRGALLHNIGLLGIDGQSEPVSPSRRLACITAGVAIVEKHSSLSPVVPILRHQGERWDGAGQPDGLAGEKIPRLARVVAIAAAFDEFMTGTQERPARSAQDAAAELVSQAGRRFDPALLDAMRGQMNAHA